MRPMVMKVRTSTSARPGVLLLALMLALSPSALPAGPGVSSGAAAKLEYQVKAAFLLNFTRYVEWPRKSGELKICVVGPDVFGNALTDEVEGKFVNGRRIAVRNSLSAAEAVTCDMAYLSLTGAQEIRDALKTLGTSAVLTVGEGAEFLRMGGMIAFTAQDGKVRFYINAIAAGRAGICISSRLLVLGKNVREEGERLR
jgi:hypothetical protein